MDYEVINKDHVIVAEIEKRQALVDDYENKIVRRAQLAVELENLDKEIASTDKNRLSAEIVELEDCAAKLGLIRYPEPEAVVEADVTEEARAEATDEPAAEPQLAY